MIWLAVVVEKPRRKSNNLIAFATVMFCDDSARDDRWWRVERSVSFSTGLDIYLEQCRRGRCV